MYVIQKNTLYYSYFQELDFNKLFKGIIRSFRFLVLYEIVCFRQILAIIVDF